ncbi:hypothetical protein GQ53DRAFT_740660 [Thozetella sp. PMI_491]|nr:hypothetical protein GQ53DRAFT_740660 [Thozetella sp. PMI_491]
MKGFAAICAALVSAVAVGAAPHLQRKDDTPYRAFNVTNFSATAVVLSHRVSYMMDIETRPGEAPLHCFALLTSSKEQLVTFTAYCDDSHTLLWSWTQNNDGSAQLDIETVPKTGCSAWLGATRYVSANETIVSGTGIFEHQVYIGPENFTMDAYYFG